MNDVRRFIRYAIPGLVFAIQLLIALSFSDYELVSKIYETKGIKEIISLVLVVFLGSGALGYLFGIIYYFLYWLGPIRKVLAIDHKSLFQQLADYIEIKNSDGRIKNLETLTKKEAWSILTRYWFTNYEESSCIKGIDQTIDRLSSIVHGNGTTVIATMFSILFWGVIHNAQPPPFFSCGILSILGVWLLFLTIAFFSYINSLRFFQSIINSTILQLLMDQHEFLKEKVTIWYSE